MNVLPSRLPDQGVDERLEVVVIVVVVWIVIQRFEAKQDSHLEGETFPGCFSLGGAFTVAFISGARNRRLSPIFQR